MATSNDSNLDVKAVELIDLLKSGPTFETSSFASALASYMYFDGQLKPLNAYMPQGLYKPPIEGIFGTYLIERPHLKQHLDNLCAGTLGLAFKNAQDQAGFSESTKEEEARKLAQKSLTSLIPHLLEAFMDSKLDEKALSHLKQLSHNKSGFADAYVRQVKKENVQAALGSSNNTPYGQTFRGSLIYVYEYLAHKETPFIRGKLPMSGSEDGSFGDIVQLWLETNKPPTQDSDLTFSEAFNKILDDSASNPQSVLKDPTGFYQDLLRTILPLEILYVPEFNMENDLPYIAQRVLEKVTKLGLNPELTKYVLSAIPKEMVSFAREFWVEWDTHVSHLSKMIQQSLGHSVEVNKEAWEQEGLRGSEKKAHWVEIIYGDEVAQCQHSLRHIDIWQKVNFIGNIQLPCDERRTYGPGARRVFLKQGSHHYESGCFASGTLVWTKDGQKHIESLCEDDLVLTRADSQEFGVRSDESVANPSPLGFVELYGFNDEKPFFTANHVFHTTTGLRAIDPQAAVRENPWLKVGHLRAGHVLRQTTNGTSYNNVFVRAIASEISMCDTVYGVHLREGLRSYHANGYLVHLNYPEITIASIARMLMTFPSTERVELLKHVEELQPLFARFGAGAMGEKLSRELSMDDDSLAQLKPQAPPPVKELPLYYQHRSFALSSTTNQQLHGYQLPFITASDGVLYVDGEACYASHITERGFMWSRQINAENDIWEHGLCSFGEDRHLLAGDGALWLQEGRTSAIAKLRPIMLKAHATAYHEPGTLLALEEPVLSKSVQMNLTTSEAAEGEQDIEESMSSLDSVPKIVTSKPIQEKRIADTAAIMGELPRESASFKRHTRQSFQLHYQSYPVGSPPDGKDDISFAICEHGTGGSTNGIEQTIFSIPALDEIGRLQSEQIRERDPKAEHKAIYETTVIPDQNGNFTVSITLSDPDGLAIAADDNMLPGADLPTAKGYKDLSFKTLGSDLKLGFMFSTLVFNVNPVLHKLDGFIAEFDPEADGDNGIQHVLRGETPPETTPKESKPPLLPVQGAEGLPPWLIKLDKKPVGLSLHGLAVNLGVDSATLKEDTQQLIWRTMLYHMDESDRKVLGYNERPLVSDTDSMITLPSAAANGLDEQMRERIREKYAPAYILQTFASSSLNEQQLRENFGINFDNKKKRRLEYFWRGNGKGCLSRSPHYDMLNRTLTKIAFRRRYKKIEDYLEDLKPIETEGPTAETQDQSLKGFVGGKKWAYLLFEDLMQEHWVKQIAEQSKITDITKFNPLETYCTILHALWEDQEKPTSTDESISPRKKSLSERLSATVKRYLETQNTFRYRSISDPKDNEDNLRDYLYQLFLLLLDPAEAKKAGIGEEFRKEFEKEMQAIGKWKSEFWERSKEHKAKAILQVWSSTISTATGLASAIPNSHLHAENGAKGMRRILNVVRKLFTQRPQPEQPAIGQMEPMSKGKMKVAGALCALLTIGMAALFVYNSWDQWKLWYLGDPKFTDLNKASLVTYSLQALGNTVLASYKVWQVFDKAKGLPSVAGIAANEKMTEMVAIAHPNVIVNNANPAAQLQAAADGINAAAGAQAAAQPQNAAQGMLPPGRVPFRQRLANWKAAAKTKIGKFWDKAKNPKPQFNIPEMWMRGTLCAIGVVLLILNAVALHELLQDENASQLEKALAIWNIAIQSLCLVVDLLTLCYAIPCSIGIALVAIGFVVSIIISTIVGEPKPPKQPITKWYEDKGEKYLADIPDPPPTRLQYQLAPAAATPGLDISMAVHGKYRQGDNGLGTLDRISVRFTSANTDSTVLFKGKGEFKVSQSLQSVAPQECNIMIPTRLTDKTRSGINEESVSKIRAWRMGVALRSREDLELKETDKMPELAVLDNEEIVFTVRGVIASALKPANYKEEAADVIPEWRKYMIRVSETYVDKDGEAIEILEEELVFVKSPPTIKS